MIKEFKELWRYRELLFVMVQRELRIRYKNSALGVLWSFLNPLAQVAVMSFVFSNFLRQDVPSFTVYMLAAYLPFIFFQSSVLDSAQSVLTQYGLIKKIYFPREILPLAAVIANMIHLLIGFLIMFGLMLLGYIRDPRVFPFQAGMVYLPFLLIVSTLFATGVSFIVSALNTFYEDVKYICQIGLYLLMYLCPIVYFVEQVANSKKNYDSGWLLYKLYMLNPVAVQCVAYRKALVAPVPTMSAGGMGMPTGMPWKYLAFHSVGAVFVFLFGYWLFNRLKWKFVERP